MVSMTTANWGWPRTRRRSAASSSAPNSATLATVLRRVLGQPQFAVVMLTIGLGAVFRSFASITWGSEIYTLPTPFSARATRIGGVSVSHEYVSIIVGTVLLCAALYAL